MKSLVATGNRSQVIILIGGAHCLSEVVTNLTFVMSCSFILCLSYLCSLWFPSTWMSSHTVILGRESLLFAAWGIESRTSQCLGYWF